MNDLAIYDSLPAADQKEGGRVTEELVSRGHSSRGSARASGVDRSKFHQRVKLSLPTDRAIRRLFRTDTVGKIHGESRGTHGHHRVAATLRIESGLIANHKLVAGVSRNCSSRAHISVAQQGVT